MWIETGMTMKRTIYSLLLMLFGGLVTANEIKEGEVILKLEEKISLEGGVSLKLDGFSRKKNQKKSLLTLARGFNITTSPALPVAY